MIGNIPGKTLIGKVFDDGNLPISSSEFFLLHPVALSGSPSEGGSATLTVDTDHSFPCYIIGSQVPVVDEYYVCHLTDTGFWIGERFKITTTGTVSYPCAICSNIPSSLNLTWSSDGCGLLPYYNATITYQTTPAWGLTLGLASSVFMSTSSFTDVDGNVYYFIMRCSAGRYVIAVGYPDYFGTGPLLSQNVMGWTVGGSNTCSPFSMTVIAINVTGCTWATLTG